MGVVGLEIARREPVLEGTYEKVLGVLRFTADPGVRQNELIADLGLAPRNARGLVEYAADFYLLRPFDGGRGRLLLDVPNRGRKLALGMFNSAARSNDPTAGEDFGNRFLMRHGYTVAWIGWQPDVPRRDGMMAMTVPRVPGVSERVRCEFRPIARVDALPLADRYHIPHPVAGHDDPEAELHVREHADAPAVTLPRSTWRFPDAVSIALEGGFQPGRIYDCYYRAQDPPVVGLGFTAVRDVASFLRWGTAAEGNPCAGAVERSYVFGVSQSGRFLRHLLYLGLDEDEAGRVVWDAVIPHVAGARRGEFNCRFGQPSLNAVHAVGSLFPFTDGEQDDPVTGQRDALLRRLAGRATPPPRIFTINTSAEYWRGDGSLVHTDVGGTRDVVPPAHVRQYLFAGTQHTPGALPPPAADPNTGGRGFHLFSVVDYSPLLRAALVNLDRWVSEGVEPPPSAVPRLADGTAVAAETTRGIYTAIPGARFPDQLQRPQRLDFGSAVARGIATLPPKLGAPFVTFVSAVDGDGNERAGIRPPELRVPLATFMGWNPRHPEQGAPGDLMAMMGSTLAFTHTAAERTRTADPRPSIEERYAGREAYLARVRRDAEEMVAARHLLAEDVDAVVERAGALWDFVCSR
jgi:hypothetical protein